VERIKCDLVSDGIALGEVNASDLAEFLPGQAPEDEHPRFHPTIACGLRGGLWAAGRRNQRRQLAAPPAKKALQVVIALLSLPAPEGVMLAIVPSLRD